MRAARCRQAVDDQIHLPQVRLDQVNHPGLHFIREGITVQAFCIQTGFICQLMKSRRVIPTRGAGFSLATGLFKEHADGRGTRAKGGGNARREPIASRCAQDQYPLRPLRDRPLGPHVGHLPPHILQTPRWVGSGAQKAANFGLNDHGGSSEKSRRKSSMWGALRSTLGRCNARL